MIRQIKAFLPVSGWAAVGAIALVSTVVAILAFFAGLKRVGPAVASIVSTLEPVVTVGLAWIVASVAIVYLVAVRVAATLTERRPHEMASSFAPMLVPLGLAWSVAHYLRASLADMQSFVALLSDPLGRGWDLFGTINNAVNYRWLTPGQAGWIETIVLLAGCCLSAYEVHRTAITVVRRQAVRAIYPLETGLVLAAVGAVALLLGT